MYLTILERLKTLIDEKEDETFTHAVNHSIDLRIMTESNPMHCTFYTATRSKASKYEATLLEKAQTEASLPGKHLN